MTNEHTPKPWIIYTVDRNYLQITGASDNGCVVASLHSLPQ